MRRFYKIAGFSETEDGYAVTLDGRPVRTPAGGRLVLPNYHLAQAVSAEWEAQGEAILPASMPLMQLTSTALDRISPNRAEIIRQLVEYAATDLLCYRAGERRLADRQELMWQPLLDWAKAEFGAVLVITFGLMPVEQPAEGLESLRRRIEDYDLWRLTALQSAVAVMGSLVLGMALVEGRLSAEEAFVLSQLDELVQNEEWGEDWEAVERRDRLRADLLAAERFLATATV
ncbi:MAG: ATPase [Rhodospirillales bacterium]|nr:ATPase [Rhodospirillales bacterium]